MNIQENVSLKNFHTFKTKASARFLTKVSSSLQLIEVFKWLEGKQLPFLILGQGSNVLFTQNFEGLVIINQIKGIEIIEENLNSVVIKCGGGENWDFFVDFTVKKNLQGLENLSGIPGTVGASPIQNIGAYGVEIKKHLVQVEYMDTSTHQIKFLQNEQCEFSYRHSIFKNALKNRAFILAVYFRLNKTPYHTYNLEYKDIQNYFNSTELPTVEKIRDLIIGIRNSKFPPLEKYGNAGSFFKNPMIDLEQYQHLKNIFPEMPSYIEDHQSVKIPAAWLIEKVGFKGKKKGHIGSYQNQALIIVNFSDDTCGSDILQFTEQIELAVFSKFKIRLEKEVNIY